MTEHNHSSDHPYIPLQTYVCQSSMLSSEEKEMLKSRIQHSIHKSIGK